ncbi:MAG: hypothetical protein HY784_01700 [Chloroflexi bacterium]|nr:hypothetical protein [Chloroflexota bacterium]
MSDPAMPPPAPSAGAASAFKIFIARLEQRVQEYLNPRSDKAEQIDHLRHVADRTRWLYYSELQRQSPGMSVGLSPHESDLLEACVLSHDIGKWIPRDELRALMPVHQPDLKPTFQKLRYTSNQSDLFLLGIRRRFALEKDGYVPEYDSAHHLVSAYILATDPNLGFQQLDPADQERLISMVVGHQFGSYFKESLMNLRAHDTAVTTGMLADVARPDLVLGDTLACCFHDADISDLLFVGSLERRPNREEIIHAGGLVKILMINFTNLINDAPQAPRTLPECLRSCQATVANVSKEFLTPAAMEHGGKWGQQAHRFLAVFREKAVAEKINAALEAVNRPAAERVNTVRLLTHMYAREFLKGREE